MMAKAESACVSERAPYHYAPLSGPHCIRVLVLKPSRSINDPIQCSFQELVLDEKDIPCGYEAISYTWGESRGSKPILCEGRTILVTPNCEQALLHLRHKAKPRTLWIDAICISQESVEEKNQQVAIMGDIYRHASHTILWLGQGDFELSETLRRAAKYGEYYNRAYGSMNRVYRRLRKKEEEDDVVYESYWQAPILSMAESDRISALCSNEWFRRMWTLQEFWLSKSTTFMMGNVTCQSEALYTYYSLGKKLVLRPNLEHFRMRSSMNGRTAAGNEQGFLSDLVRLAALNKTTDARDKVYGMIAYIESRCPCADLNVVDYTKSISEVYETFTRSLISTTNSLWPLELVTGQQSSSSDNMPSWVVDLRDPDFIAPEWSWRLNRRSTLERSAYKFSSTTNKSGQLKVLAKQVGDVLSVSSRMPFWSAGSEKISREDMDSARSMCLSEWTAFVTDLDMQEDGGIENTHFRALENFTSELNYLCNRHKLEDEIDIDTWPHRTPKKAAKERKKQFKAIRKKAAKTPSFWDHETCVHDMCCLFLTSTGHLGESPGDVRVGDSIFIIQGAEHPFALRRKGHKFFVVGKVSVHATGKMDWSPAKLSSDEDAQTIVLI